jgi:ADP-heptose:LPS heptosyltransferase
LIGRLRRQRYRLIVDLRTDGLSWLLRGEQRRTKRDAISPGVHAVERAYAVIAALLPPTTPCIRLWLADEHQRYAVEQLRALPGDRLLEIAPGANWSGKIWPEAKFRELIDTLAAKVDALLLLGGQGDAAVCASLARTSRLPVLNLAGKTTLLQAAALLSRAMLFIGNDSGLGHLCAAVGRPTLTLFGPGDPDRYHPWGRQSHWLVAADGNIASLPPTAVANRAIELLRPQESINQ